MYALGQYDALVKLGLADKPAPKTYYHGSPERLTQLRANSWVTPYKDDAAIFAVPWSSNEIVPGASRGDGRPPKKLEFKDPNKIPKDHPIYVYEIQGDVKPALTNTGRNYAWNKQTLTALPAKHVMTVPSWHNWLLVPSQQTKRAEYAPGIPDRNRTAPLPDIRKPTPWKMTVQEHHAERAGLHYDLRLIDPETGDAHSWALPAAKLPAPGEKVLAVQQPTHTSEYSLNFGKDKLETINSGYGKGTVRQVKLEDIDMYHMKPEETGTRVRFNTYTSKGPQEYVIIRTQKGQDLLLNKTMTRQRLPHLSLGDKPKVKEHNFHGIDIQDNTHVIMPKYDGAHTILDLKAPGKIPRLYSYRIPKKHTAGVIEHTHKVPDLLTTRVPVELKGTVLRAETIAIDPKKKAIPATDIGGMLNATVHQSRQKQIEMQSKLRPILLDIEKYKGKDMSNIPFSRRYELLKDIGKQLDMQVADAAFTPEQKKKLLERIQRGKHPLTQEGVILRPLNTPGGALKAKLRPDHDVYVRNIFQAIDKNGQPLGRAGGFEYSWTPDGPIKGRVGTGFNHALAKDMLDNPHRYKGRVAKVEAELVTKNEVLAKPSFIEWHIEKGQIVG